MKTTPSQHSAGWSPKAFWERPQRPRVMLLSLVLGAVFVGLLTAVLSGRAAVLVLDHPSIHFPYPFTIQNVMHLIFFLGLGEVYARWRSGTREEKYLYAHFLPEDDHTILEGPDLGPIRRKIAGEFDHDSGFLPSMIDMVILQFQSSNSVEQSASVLNTHLELTTNRVDLRYGLVRFIAWVVPTLGFIGTVYGLGASLASAGDPGKALDLNEVARTLGVGFDCTMVALMESAVLVFVLHLVQEKEETSLNNAADYTLRNLINRLYTGGK